MQNINPNSTQPQYFLGYANLKVFAEAMLKRLLLIIGTVSLLMLILNGFKYLTSRGEKEQLESAKKGLTWALAGLALALLAYTLVSAIAKLIS